MSRFTNRQVIVLCVMSMGFGALFSPPLKSVAQPPTPDSSEEARISQTPQPLATPPATSDASTPTTATRAIGTITGQGTAGYISKFTGANAIGNSILFENGGKIGLGTTTPAGLLSVKGTAANVYSIYALGVGSAIIGSSSGNVGVYGAHTDATGSASGVLGDTASTAANAVGVQGIVKSTAPGANSAGIYGINRGTSTNGFGVIGTHAGGGSGVFGSSPAGNGVLGDSTSGAGVRGRHLLNSGTAPGVSGETNSTSDNATGVQGIVNSTSPGNSSTGVRGINNGTGYSGIGVYGSHAGYGTGVYGISSKGIGVQGRASSNSGVQGISSTSSGVYGVSTSGIGVYGSSDSSYGTYGTSYSSTGVYGHSFNSTGVYGDSTNGYAGYFQGNVVITGNLAKASGSFKIDHPQHPATEYLSHSFVESPDMMNVYNGNATTNSKGEAWVKMPSYFQSLNRDFRYQLTPIGQFAQAIVGQEISGNRFLIRTDKPNVKVSWQVTGIRNDAYARQHRIRVEESKTGSDRGKYLYPAGFGAGHDKQIGAAKPRLAQR